MLTQGQVCGLATADTAWELGGNEDYQMPPADLQNLRMWGCWIQEDVVEQVFHMLLIGARV